MRAQGALGSYESSGLHSLSREAEGTIHEELSRVLVLKP